MLGLLLGLLLAGELLGLQGRQMLLLGFLLAAQLLQVGLLGLRLTLLGLGQGLLLGLQLGEPLLLLLPGLLRVLCGLPELLLVGLLGGLALRLGLLEMGHLLLHPMLVDGHGMHDIFRLTCRGTRVMVPLHGEHQHADEHDVHQHGIDARTKPVEEFGQRGHARMLTVRGWAEAAPSAGRRSAPRPPAAGT